MARRDQFHSIAHVGGTGTVLDFPCMIDATDTDDGPSCGH